ncbi:hypothetical protein GCM10027569_57430 [Flindersiella endophytica]
MPARGVGGDVERFVYEAGVAAAMVEMVVGVHHEQRQAGELAYDRADRRDARTGVEEQRRVGAGHQEAVGMARLGDEPAALAQIAYVEPVRQLARPGC